MRGVLNDWLVAIHVRFRNPVPGRQRPQPLPVCASRFARKASARWCDEHVHRSKVDETCSPSVSAYLCTTNMSYTKEQILQAGRYILKTLEYNMSYPNPVHFLRRVSKADDYDIIARTLAKYLYWTWPAWTRGCSLHHPR
jgi:G2/mitotic-specific cyclin 2